MSGQVTLIARRSTSWIGAATGSELQLRAQQEIAVDVRDAYELCERNLVDPPRDSATVMRILLAHRSHHSGPQRPVI